MPVSMQAKQPDPHGHIWNDRDALMFDDDGEYSRYAKCSICGAIENSDESVLDCPKRWAMARKECVRPTWYCQWQRKPYIFRFYFGKTGKEFAGRDYWCLNIGLYFIDFGYSF